MITRPRPLSIGGRTMKRIQVGFAAARIAVGGLKKIGGVSFPAGGERNANTRNERSSCGPRRPPTWSFLVCRRWDLYVPTRSPS